MIASYWHDKKQKRAIISLLHSVCFLTIIFTQANLILLVVEQSARAKEILEEFLVFSSILIFYNIFLGFLYFKRNALETFIMSILVTSFFISVRLGQMENIKLVIIDLKQRYYVYTTCLLATVANFIAFSRMFRELMGAIEKNMSMKSDFELILQSL